MVSQSMDIWIHDYLLSNYLFDFLAFGSCRSAFLVDETKDEEVNP